METETIDLTDPLEDLLRQTGWTSEYLQERLSRVSNENVKKANANIKDLTNLTLSDLLGDYKCSNSKDIKDLKVIETIELSDDEVSEETDQIINQEDSEIQEVRVIEVNEEYESDCSEDDDDEFLEESADIFQSNNDNVSDNSLGIEEKGIDDSNNCLPLVNSTQSKKNLTSQIDDQSHQRSDVPKKNTDTPEENNIEDICISTAAVKNSFSKSETLATTNDNGTFSRMSPDKEESSINEEKQDLDNSNNYIQDQNLNEKKIQDGSLNLRASSSATYKRAQSELIESLPSDILENDHNIGSDLGFIVSEVRGGINLIDSFPKIDNISDKGADNNSKDKTSKGLEIYLTNKYENVQKQNIMVNKQLVPEIEGNDEVCKLSLDQNKDRVKYSISEKLANQIESDSTILTNTPDQLHCNILPSKFGTELECSKSMDGTKTVRKSPNDIIEHLDMACQEDIAQQRKTKDNKGDIPDTSLSIPNKHDSTRKINNSASLLLKSLDEAIQTCERNKDYLSSSDSLPNIEILHNEHHTKLNKEAILVATVKKPMKSIRNLKFNDCKVSIAKNIIFKENRSLSVASDCALSKNVDDSINSSVDNKAETSRNITSSNKVDLDLTERTESNNVVSDNSAHNSKVNPVANDNKSKVKSTFNEEAKKVVSSTIQNNIFYTSSNIILNVKDAYCENKGAVLTTTIVKQRDETVEINDFPVAKCINDDAEKSYTFSTETANCIDNNINNLSKEFIGAESRIKNDKESVINKVVESNFEESEKQTEVLCSDVDNIENKNSNLSSNLSVNMKNKGIDFNKYSNNTAEQSDEMIECKIQKTDIKDHNNTATKSKVIENKTSKYYTDDQKNKNLDDLNKETHIIEDGIPSRLLITSNNSTSNVNSTNKTITLANTTEEGAFIRLQPNLGKSSTIMEQPCNKGESLDQEKLFDSEEIILKEITTKGYIKEETFSTNKNLIEFQGSDDVTTNNINDDSEDDNNEEEKMQENFEEIRKNLMLQLTSLRNRKRIDILQAVKTNAVNIDLSSKNHSFSERRHQVPLEVSEKSANSEPSKEPNKHVQQAKQDSIMTIDPSKTKFEIEKQEDTLVSNIPVKQSLVPQIAHLEETAHPDSLSEKHNDDEVPNVLNEIRKIIWKQKVTPKISLSLSGHNSKINTVPNEIQRCNKQESYDTELVDSSVLHALPGDNKDLQALASSNLQDEKIPSSNNTNSPFISNRLDEFLTDAKLNVSYTIPKSGAEEGLRQTYSDEPIMPLIVAEIKEESEKSMQELKYKPKTLAEKRRLLEKNKLKEKKRSEKLKRTEESQKRSYVLFKDKKIFLKAKSVGKCIASIESSAPVSIKDSTQPATPKKPSLLTELYKKATTPVKYRPGPLCKKYLLQTDYSNWTSELQTLPKVILKVMPQLRKPIHPNLLHILPQWDGEVNDDQIEFALSALVTKEKQKQNKIFEFNAPYKNQQTQILTRKRMSDKPTIQLEHLVLTKQHTSNPEEDVAKVIEKLLTYVEIKEIAPTLINYDQDFSTSEEIPVDTKVPALDNHVVVKRKSRITKTDRELIRLNCKVVSVEVEENEPERQCSKPYCRLGCICKSLQCDRIIGLHCQKAKCIFGCTCPKEKDKIISIAEPTVKVPAGTDFLSMDTVTRIEGEAKRNLAKVEKEFTQTVILTNDKTIVVGFGNKPRRATRAPKKYTDFFDDESLTLKDENNEPKKDKVIPIRPCSIALEKWDFSDILPYCLVHHLYICHCRGNSVFSPNISSSNKKESDELLKLKKEEYLSSSAESTASISFNKYDSNNHHPRRTVEESFKAIIRKSVASEQNLDVENDFEETLYSVTGRPLRKKKKIYEADFVFDEDAPSSSRKLSQTEGDSLAKTQILSGNEHIGCSRTKKISSRYYRKKRLFNNQALYVDFANNLTQADLLKAIKQENDSNISDCDLLKRTIIEERKKILEGTEIEIHKKRRKQKIQVRNDEDIMINSSRNLVPPPKQIRKGKVKSVFKGEIIINDSVWLKNLVQNAKQPLEGYARILPWTALLNGFLSKSINVYCISDMPLRLLLNVGVKLTGNKILDVETDGHNILAAPLKAKSSWSLGQSENVREIVKWLLSGTLPSRYTTNSLSFLLVETFPDHFEVRGLCTQGENKHEVEENQSKPVLPNDGEISDQVTEVKHKNMNNEIKSLFITKGKFRLRELVEEGCDDDHTDNLYMWVGLPEVYKVAKWRVVFLNNDFALLYFKNIQYSIKYTDLVKLTEIAKKETVTLILRNVQIRRNYDHTLFGIYISHNYADRIFIGPYFTNYDEDEVETLRYINQQLVSTESFNKMTGNDNHRCGHWMFERTYYHTPTVYMKDTIDLTSDKTPPRRSKSTLKTTLPALSKSISVPIATNSTPDSSISHQLMNSSKDDHIIYHNGMSIHIKNSKPRSPSEFNRFIITNIPHFGYLGAYQLDNSSALEVSWPFEKKVLQFENADNARDFLQERFNQLLQPVPETFKIQVIVLIQLDLKEHQPINSDFLSGHCICGYFGTYNFKKLSDEFCQEKLNISKEEITKLFAKRAHAYIRKKIEELAEVVGINRDDPDNFNVPAILDKAKKEIRSQESIRRQQISEIHTYELNFVSKMKKIYGIVNALPAKDRNIESRIINEILQIRPKRLGFNEVVEIKDDDDDGSDSACPKLKSDPAIYVICDDTNFTRQPKKKSLKRKRSNEDKTRIIKVAKIAPFTPGSYVEPSSSVSILKSKPETTGAIVRNIVTNKGKQSILLVRPQRTETQPKLETENMEIRTINEDTEIGTITEIATINEDTEIATINEDTETIIINEDTDMALFNEEIRAFTCNEDIETFTFNEDGEMVAINKDRTFNEEKETVTNNKDVETETLNDKKGIISDNDDIEMIINADAETLSNEGTETVTTDDNMETETVDDNSDYQNKKTKNIVDDDQFIIEYSGSDSNITEIFVSQPDAAENIDLSRATIIASVPPTSDKNPTTVSKDLSETQYPEFLCKASSLKTYSRSSKPCTITSLPSELDTTDVDSSDKNKIEPVITSKELKGKIKLGLQKIMKKAEGNLLFRNERDP